MTQDNEEPSAASAGYAITAGADKMTIDPDTCRDPELLAAEVRRLQAVIAAEPTQADDLSGEIARYLWGISALRHGLTMPGDFIATVSAALRAGFASGQIRAFSGTGKPAETAYTPPEPAIPPEWMSRPYYVDPPSGWRYGFPKLYDPASDGNMVEWMIASGYPEKLARRGLACTFTAATEDGEK